MSIRFQWDDTTTFSDDGAVKDNDDDSENKFSHLPIYTVCFETFNE